MKILQLSNYFYPHFGGIEQVARDLGDAFEKAGVSRADQRVLCFRHDKGKDSVDEVDGMRITRAACFAKVSSQSLSFSYGKLLRREMKEFAPDLVIFHHPNPFMAHFLLKEMKKYPSCKLIVVWHLDIFKQKFLKLFFKKQSRRLLERAQKVVATSPNYVDGSAELSSVRDKCVVVPNCADTAQLELTAEDEARAAEIRRENEGKTLCFALGRHVPYKGMTHLVGAAAYLDENYAVCIGGVGPLTEKLKKQAKGDRKVKFLGRMSDRDKKAYLCACDVFCFPSITKNEAFGIALAEGMYFAHPAVTFTIAGSGVNYVSVGGETGIEVQNGDDKAFADAIKTLATDRALRREYGKNAKERVLRLFTKEIFCENVAALLQTL